MMSNNIRKKVLTSPSSFGQIDSAPINLLEENGYEVINNPYGRKLTENEVIDLAQNCIGIVAGVEPITRTVLDKLPELRCISRVGVGIDNIDLNYTKKRQVQVLTTPDGPTQSVTELTLGMTLSLLRQIPQANSNMKSKLWKKQTGFLLLGKVIGVVGLGRIGRAVSKMFSGLGNQVIGFDINPDIAWATDNNITLKNMKELVAESDIVSLHIPNNKDGTPVFDKELLSLMKNNSFLINLSRGGVVDENALFTRLDNGDLTGAAIDVFQEEPYYGKLNELDNVVLTPHIGSYAREGKLQMEIDAANNLINALKENE